MMKTPWMLLCSPHSPSVVWPGHFITDKSNPQNYYSPTDATLSSSQKRSAQIEALAVSTPSLVHSLSKNTKLSLNLSSFASQYFSKSKSSYQNLEACQATRYLLLQADVWLDHLSANAEMQEWLKKRIMRDRKKVWMVTGVLTLSDTHITLSSSRRFGLGVGGAVPLLAAAGIPLPSADLAIGVDVRGERAEGQERSFRVPDEKVFEIQLSRIRLKRGKGSGTAALTGDKPKWVPHWDTRGSWADEEWESEEEEDFFEAGLGDDTDEDEYEELVLQSGDVEGLVSAQKPSGD